MNETQPPPVDVLSTREGYDRWSRIYDVDDNPLVALEGPQSARLLGNVRGLSVLDVGCGTGRHALALADAGAHVTAADFSEGMLQKARGKPGADRIRFMRFDLAETWPLAPRSFDRVICGLVVDHIADLAGFFASCAAVCKANGSIVVSTLHPAMMLKGVQARFTDPETGRETRPASVANQISDYVMGAVRAGVRIDEMSEHMVDETLTSRSPRAVKYLGWPLLLMFRLRP